MPDRLRRFARRASRIHLDIDRARIVLAQGTHVLTSEFDVPLAANAQGGELAALRDRLSHVLAQLAPAQAALDITFSDTLARQWIFRRPPGVRLVNELDAVARLDMQRIYGDAHAAESAWLIRYDAQPFLDRWPAMALPQWLVDSVGEAVPASGHDIATLRSRFTASVGSLRPRLGARLRRQQPVIHVLEAADGITLGIRVRQQWLSLRSYPLLAAQGIELPALLERESRAAGIPLGECQVDVRQWPGGRA